MAYRRLVGRGIEADPEGAFHDFQAAAAQGDPYAIFNVGYMHLRVGMGRGQVRRRLTMSTVGWSRSLDEPPRTALAQMYCAATRFTHLLW